MVEEESDDAEAVVKLLELNDIINTIVEKYSLIKKGDINGAKALPTVAPHPTPSAPTKAPAADESLIDLLGGEIEPANGSSSAAGPSNVNSLQDDLLGLSIDDPSASIGQGGGIALGFGANTSIAYYPWIAVFNVLIGILGIPGPPLLSSTMQSNTAGQQQISPSPSPKPSASGPDYAAIFGALSTPRLPGQRTDAPPKPSGDEEWAFTSALPQGSEIKSNEILVMDSNLRVVMEVNWPVPDGPILLRAKFSNNASQPIQDLTFQMAVTKVQSRFAGKGTYVNFIAGIFS
jgi:ADP-ribosylation factor-binding protein GGA